MSPIDQRAPLRRRRWRLRLGLIGALLFVVTMVVWAAPCCARGAGALGAAEGVGFEPTMTLPP